MRRAMMLMLLTVAALSLAACSANATTPAAEGALMAVQSRGGMCIEGSCESTVYVERDGLVHMAAEPPNELGIVPAEAMAELERQIAQADFAELRSHPFTGMCPTAVDGQELVFEFATASGVERMSHARSRSTTRVRCSARWSTPWVGSWASPATGTISPAELQSGALR
ncbi:MAG TPA: hypothetical protein VEX62_11590 [Candidatus Limnocylindrales bacterium]|nr:hypothetical protein [Candidatus Limnocylindrales bacterium]